MKNKYEFDCEVHNEHYFKLKTKALTWKQIIPYYAMKAVTTVLGIPSYVLGRILTLLIFDPLFSVRPEQDDYQFRQNSQHPDGLHREDFAVVNVTDKPSLATRIIRNYARMANNNMPFLPKFITNFVQGQILRINDVDEKKCNELIGRFSQQLNGINLNGKKIKQLDPNVVFFKGTEFIEPKLRERFYQLINQLVSQTAHNAKDFDIRENNKKIQFFTLESRDGAVLDSAEIVADGEADKDYNNRTFVISCMPRNNNFSAWLKRHRIYANEIGTTFVSFNYRGVERSRGIILNQNYMVRDAIAQAERLLALGVKPKNIAFQGECLGAAVATMAAAKMHERGYKVSLFSSRSFRSTTKVVLYNVLPKKGASPFNPLNWLRYFAAGLLFVIFYPLLKIAGWNMDAAEAYDSIPYGYKGFLNAESDPSIGIDDASIYSYMEEKRDALRQAAKNNPALSEGVNELASLEEHKFDLNDQDRREKNINTHACPLQMLHNHDKNARSYQIEFFKQTFIDRHPEQSEGSPELGIKSCHRASLLCSG